MLRALRGIEVHVAQHDVWRDGEVLDEEIARFVTGLGPKIFPHGQARQRNAPDLQVAHLIWRKQEVHAFDDGFAFGRPNANAQVVDQRAIGVSRRLCEDGADLVEDAEFLAPLGGRLAGEGDE